jgi:hypothetical protein
MGGNVQVLITFPIGLLFCVLASVIYVSCAIPGVVAKRVATLVPLWISQTVMLALSISGKKYKERKGQEGPRGAVVMCPGCWLCQLKIQGMYPSSSGIPGKVTIYLLG